MSKFFVKKKRAWRGDKLYRLFVVFFCLILLTLATYGILSSKNIPIWLQPPANVWVNINDSKLILESRVEPLFGFA